MRAWDIALQRILSEGPAIMQGDEFLTAAASVWDPGRFGYYAAVAALDMIYLQSIAAFGASSVESTEVAAALRSHFENKINRHLRNNLQGLWDFTTLMTNRSELHAGRLLPTDLHGAWVTMAFEGNSNTDFTESKVVQASKHVSAWLHRLVENVFE